MSNESKSAVSPEAFISTQFNEACQEIAANPQDVFHLLLFSFLQITPEERGTKLLEMKRDFNTFAEAVNFKELQGEIDQRIEKAELGLSDSLAQFWNEDV